MRIIIVYIHMSHMSREPEPEPGLQLNSLMQKRIPSELLFEDQREVVIVHTGASTGCASHTAES